MNSYLGVLVYIRYIKYEIGLVLFHGAWLTETPVLQRHKIWKSVIVAVSWRGGVYLPRVVIVR